MSKLRYALYTLILLLATLGAAEVGTTGANYLKIGLGAKASAIGENFTALANDSSAVYWNAAGLSQARTSSLDFMQLNWVAGISAKTFFGVHPLSDTDTVGGYVFMLDTPYDTETQYSSDGLAAYETTGDKFKSAVSVVNVSYAKKLSADLSLGLSVKSIAEDLAGTKSNGLAADVGSLYTTPIHNLTIGLTAHNLPIHKLRDDEDLPQDLTFGAAYVIGFGANKLNLLSDIKLPNDNDMRYGVGCEYVIADIFSARVGYNSLYKISMGMGVSLVNLVADYAYVPVGDLGITHRISVGYRFDSSFAVAEVKKAEPTLEEKKQSEEAVLKNEGIFDGANSAAPTTDVITAPAVIPEAVSPSVVPSTTETTTDNLLSKIEF